mmetsp:Transcript_14708/g.34919  ORF Transcript_14708/g.34919 Transcript_14708/m.34919 type:complete len:315 (-) Transcript_14708:350-1294(-)
MWLLLCSVGVLHQPQLQIRLPAQVLDPLEHIRLRKRVFCRQLAGQTEDAGVASDPHDRDAGHLRFHAQPGWRLADGLPQLSDQSLRVGDRDRVGGRSGFEALPLHLLDQDRGRNARPDRAHPGPDLALLNARDLERPAARVPGNEVGGSGCGAGLRGGEEADRPFLLLRNDFEVDALCTHLLEELWAVGRLAERCSCSTCKLLCAVCLSLSFELLERFHQLVQNAAAECCVFALLKVLAHQNADLLLEHDLADRGHHAGMQVDVSHQNFCSPRTNIKRSASNVSSASSLLCLAHLFQLRLHVQKPHLLLRKILL